jgi:hypothetical protein
MLRRNNLSALGHRHGSLASFIFTEQVFKGGNEVNAQVVVVEISPSPTPIRSTGESAE